MADLFGHDIAASGSTTIIGQGPTIVRGATFRGPEYRITLSRQWSDQPMACVIGHNPSNAGAEADDPTSKWWNRWFQYYGFGGYVAVNLYPDITASPADVYRRLRAFSSDAWYAREEVNLPAVVEAARAAKRVFVCWGNIARDPEHIEHVLKAVQPRLAPPWGKPPIKLWCWGKTASGAPMHPMARGRHRLDPLAQPILWRAG